MSSDIPKAMMVDAGEGMQVVDQSRYAPFIFFPSKASTLGY